MHRAMDGGIGDVGGGVLYGLSDYRFDTIAMIMHNRELENKYGVGFHTVSVPRLQKAPGMNISDYPHIISDLEFKKIVAILRLSMPYLGIIMSTRESEVMRNELIKYGVTQISAGSKTGVGGYSEEDKNEQFAFLVLLWGIQVLRQGWIGSARYQQHLPTDINCRRNREAQSQILINFI